jgi:mandelate racemase
MTSLWDRKRMTESTNSTLGTDLKIRSVETTGVMVPLRYALGTSAAVVKEAPLLLVDLHTDAGLTGRTYLFCYQPSGALAIAAVLREAVALVAGRPAAPAVVSSFLSRRYALLGIAGPVRMALSALDTALWDVIAQTLGKPLATVLGAEPQPIRAYNSCGLGLMGASATAAEAVELLEGGFAGVKLRLGYPTLEDDVAVARAVRRAVPDHVAIPADFNQALNVAEAIRRGRALQSEGIYWIEEPVRHDDLRGNAAIAHALDVPLQLGENLNGPEAMADALVANACDYVMPDVNRIGGVTGWMQASGIAAAHGIAMSSHLLPEISVQLLAATPTRHWLEYVDWADAVLTEPMRIIDGHAHPLPGPGLGLMWDERKIARLNRI